MQAIDALGYVAAVLSSSILVPQVVETWRTQNVEGMSILSFSCGLLSAIMWLTYGILLELTPVIVSQTVLLVCSLCIVVGYIVFKKRDASEA